MQRRQPKVGSEMVTTHRCAMSNTVSACAVTIACDNQGAVLEHSPALCGLVCPADVDDLHHVGFVRSLWLPQIRPRCALVSVQRISQFLQIERYQLLGFCCTRGGSWVCQARMVSERSSERDFVLILIYRCRKQNIPAVGVNRLSLT